jgi:hypothetical protein
MLSALLSSRHARHVDLTCPARRVLLLLAIVAVWTASCDAAVVEASETSGVITTPVPLMNSHKDGGAHTSTGANSAYHPPHQTAVVAPTVRVRCRSNVTSSSSSSSHNGSSSNGDSSNGDSSSSNSDSSSSQSVSPCGSSGILDTGDMVTRFVLDRDFPEGDSNASFALSDTTRFSRASWDCGAWGTQVRVVKSGASHASCSKPRIPTVTITLCATACSLPWVWLLDVGHEHVHSELIAITLLPFARCAGRAHHRHTSFLRSLRRASSSLPSWCRWVAPPREDLSVDGWSTRHSCRRVRSSATRASCCTWVLMASGRPTQSSSFRLRRECVLLFVLSVRTRTCAHTRSL